jgi:hypothetical protein
MTVAALIVTSGTPGDDRPLARLVDAAWSGGAHPILVSGLAAGTEPPTPARRTTANDPAAALADARGQVQGTSAIILLPYSHAGIDPESITTLIAAHGRAPTALLTAAHEGQAGPVRLLPDAVAGDGVSHLVETGDEAAVTPSNGSARLNYDAPPSDSGAVDPWEQRGDQTR